MKHTITLIPGDGIGPEVSRAVQQIIAAANVEVDWEEMPARADVERSGADYLHSGMLDSIRRNKVGLKGPLETGVIGGIRSINVGLRQELDLYSNLRPVRNIEGVKSLRSDVGLTPREARDTVESLVEALFTQAGLAT